MSNGIITMKNPDILTAAISRKEKSDAWRGKSPDTTTREKMVKEGTADVQVESDITPPVSASNGVKNENDEPSKSPKPSTAQPIGKNTTPASSEKTKTTYESRKPRHFSSSYQHPSLRPGLVPTPAVFAWPQSQIASQWPGYAYLNNAGRIHQPLPIYSYPANYFQVPSSPGSQDSRSSNFSGSGASSPFSPQYQNQAGNGEKLSKTNLYIRGLHSSTTDDDLVAMCEKYGTIISTKAILYKDASKRCQGYGFVDFDSPSSAQRAVTALQNQGIQAQMARQQEQDPTNLYLANLPEKFEEHQLQQLLKPYGTVVSIRILRDPCGVSKGVGFARLESKEICEHVIEQLNGKYLPGGPNELGHYLPGSTKQMLVKFADGGSKKGKGEKPWRNPEMVFLPPEAVRSPPAVNGSHAAPGRNVPLMQNSVASHNHRSSGGHVHAYPVVTAPAVGWMQQQSGYNIAHSPESHSTQSHSPEGHSLHQQHISHQQANVMSQQLINQVAQMYLGGQYIAGVPTIGGGYSPHNTWQAHQPAHTQTPIHIDEGNVIMTAS